MCGSCCSPLCLPWPGAGWPVLVTCQAATVVASDPNRVAVHRGGNALWAQSLLSVRREAMEGMQAAGTRAGPRAPTAGARRAASARGDSTHGEGTAPRGSIRPPAPGAPSQPAHAAQQLIAAVTERLRELQGQLSQHNAQASCTDTPCLALQAALAG